MPIIKSAIKRMRQTKVKSLRNTITKKLLKETIKEFESLAKEGKIAELVKLYPALQKKIDLAVKKNLWHANKAGRVKSRYSKMLGTEKKVEKKTEEKKAPAKKIVAKKPAAKKIVVKKIEK